MRGSAEVTADRLVTGEAVVVELPAAGVGLRFLSGAIDVVTEVGLFGFTLWAMRSVLAELDGPSVTGIVLALSAAYLVALPTACETLVGRTLGKLVVGLRTVRDDGGPVDLRRALARHLIGYVEVFALGGFPAFVAGVLTTPTRRLGDIAAGTFVSRDRVPLPAPAPRPPVSRQVAAWAAGADLAGLPDELLLRVRTALGQEHKLTPQARHAVALRFVEQLHGRLAPPPPAGADPHDVLVAVLHERRERDAARLARDERLRDRLFPA